MAGARALDWVRARNSESEGLAESEPGFVAMRDGLRSVVDSRELIPYAKRRGDQFYNVWRSDRAPRGLWRRSTLTAYRKRGPAWETMIDLDTLPGVRG